MIDLGGYIQNEKNSLSEMIQENKLRRRVYIECSYSQFCELLAIEANKIMARRTDNPIFVIDKFNEPVIIELHRYLCGDSKFHGSLDKNIILAGKIGCGKTVLMKAFCMLISTISSKNITQYHSVQLATKIRKLGGISEEMIRKPLFIDDIGKEQESVMDYGTEIKPISNLISERYDYGSWTFATTNYKMDTFIIKYSEHTADRLNEIFNFIELQGETRRNTKKITKL